jgi:hypothetical protein
MGARIRVPPRAPPRVLLPCVAVCLVAAGAAVIGVAGAAVTGGYLLRQADDTVRACASGVLSRGLVAAPGSSPVLPGCGIELFTAGGQILIPATPAAGPGVAPAGPGVAAGGRWLAAHLGRPVTVTGGGGGRWRVIVEAVGYQPQRIPYVYGAGNQRYVIGGRTSDRSRGMLAVLAELPGTGRATARYAAAAGIVLVLLAATARALTRVPPRPRRGAVTAPGQLEDTCLRLRRSVTILRGFTEYCRQPERPPPASFDRMLRRVTDEITRMEALIEELRTRAAG